MFLDLLEKRHNGLFRERGNFTVRFVPPANIELARFDLSQAHFKPERDPLLDPLPRFFTAAEIARIDDHAEGLSLVVDFFQTGGKLLAGLEHFGAGLVSVNDREDDEVGGGNSGGSTSPSSSL